ncbi:hypothetical protein CKF94_15590 [Vibrio coralliilyticus]|uniref:hypothetical protein n=1 Tax=Vibrio coralliilyticus TaxID=190893 RepID=UPI000BAAD777|nr:hypothetical protein [Vibrio coralliilyticus]PAU37307.1 hypothetical protein CKF94_15590 [Vibrio coralliilyticus]
MSEKEIQVSTKHKATPEKLTDFNEDEIELDIKAGILAIWEDRLTVFISVFLITSGILLYFYNQPDSYRTSAKLEINRNFYGTESISLPVVTNDILSQSFIENYLSNSEEVINMDMFEYASVTYSLDDIYIENFGATKDTALSPVILLYKNLNIALKNKEIRDLEIAIDSTKSLVDKPGREKVQDYIETVYIQQLYKKDILENSKSELVQGLLPPETEKVDKHLGRLAILGLFIGMFVGILISILRISYRNILEK